MVAHIPGSDRSLRSVQCPGGGKLSDVEAQVLVDIEGIVQHPPVGLFGMRDIKWQLEFRARRGKHGKDQHVQQCYVPATRIQDFIAGIQSGSEGTQCVYRETKEDHKRREDAREGARTPLSFSRWHCEYGPKDYFGNVKTITTDLLPSARKKLIIRKVTAAASGSPAKVSPAKQKRVARKAQSAQSGAMHVRKVAPDLRETGRKW